MTFNRLAFLQAVIRRLHATGRPCITYRNVGGRRFTEASKCLRDNRRRRSYSADWLWLHTIAHNEARRWAGLTGRHAGQYGRMSKRRQHWPTLRRGGIDDELQPDAVTRRVLRSVVPCNAPGTDDLARHLVRSLITRSWFRRNLYNQARASFIRIPDTNQTGRNI